MNGGQTADDDDAGGVVLRGIAGISLNELGHPLARVAAQSSRFGDLKAYRLDSLLSIKQGETK